jgi:hypothetical protein
MNKTYQHVCLSAAYMLAAFKNNENQISTWKEYNEMSNLMERPWHR